MLGCEYDLPEPIGLDGWFYYETLRTHDFKDTYLSVGLTQARLHSIFDEVIQLSTITHPYYVLFETNWPIYLCSVPNFDLHDCWLMDRNIDSRVLERLQNHGVTAAISYYHESMKIDPARLLFLESHINNLGYEYLSDGKVEDANALFQLNADVFPESSNVYDSLGERYMEGREYRPAIMNYREPLELNPCNTNAKNKIREIEN